MDRQQQDPGVRKAKGHDRQRDDRHHATRSVPLDGLALFNAPIVMPSASDLYLRLDVYPYSVQVVFCH